MRCRIERLRALVEREHRIERVGWLHGLNPENRQVLGHVVSEDRAEYAEVVSSAVAGSDHRLLSHLVGNAETRREVY